ncbi:hypothetical protein BBJ28_00022470 [Nothophytophthora sp. Chile5]|nr:hypothetical protein BBJ28_00022470 [Nothophytophthora sp. Chile5]
MAPSVVYAYFKPLALDTVGYAYGKATLPAGNGDRASVRRVSSGRWSDGTAYSASRARSEIELREVSAAEATSGIGTYVGSCICVSRIPSGAAKSWDYGVVVGYTWDEVTSSGVLHISFLDGVDDVVYNERVLQDLAVESYGLRPCAGRSVSDVMPREMRMLHQAAYDHFNGVGKKPTRNANTILRTLAAPMIDERLQVPLFDMDASVVVLVSIKYILDYAYYSGGQRRVSRGVTLGVSVFDDVVSTGNPTAPTTTAPTAPTPAPVSATAPPVLPLPISPALTTAPNPDHASLDQLSDSDNDSVDASTPSGGGVSALPSSGKRKRRSDDSDDEAAGIRQLVALKDSLGKKSVMAREIDRFLSFKRSSLGRISGSEMVDRGGVSESTAQFRPSSMQQTIHRRLVHGTFSLMGPQLLVETLQLRSDSLPFLPHPAILRGLYSWDFGLRGLSVMHFASVTTQQRRASSRTYDMTDFSRKNTLPPPSIPTTLSDLLEVLDGLASIVGLVYQPFVSVVLSSARVFVLQLRANQGFSQPSAVLEVVHWLNERLEQFRGHLASGDTISAAAVADSFTEGHPSFVRVLHAIMAQRLDVTPAGPASASKPPKFLSSVPARKSHGSHSTQRTPVPPHVVQALPAVNGKALCMRYISNLGCAGRNGGCFVKYRGHFKPSSLDPTVLAFIGEFYGGLKQEFADIKSETRAA